MTLQQGDLCPHCTFIIVMPPDLDPICLCCGGNVLHEEESEWKTAEGVLMGINEKTKKIIYREKL